MPTVSMFPVVPIDFASYFPCLHSLPETCISQTILNICDAKWENRQKTLEGRAQGEIYKEKWNQPT